MISLKNIPWKTISKQVGYWCKNHSTQILTGLSCVGTVATAIVTAKQAPKAVLLLEQARMDKGDELTWQEKVKATWKCYIPTAACVGASLACGIASNVKSLKTEAALLSAYSLAQDASKVYQDKVVETVGERKERTIRDKANQTYLEHSDKDISITNTGLGDNLMYLKFSGRYIRASREALDRIMYEVRNEINSDGYMSVNEIEAGKIGLRNTDAGDALGYNKWSMDTDFTFLYTYNDPAALPEVGEAAIVVEMIPEPQTHFNKVW